MSLEDVTAQAKGDFELASPTDHARVRDLADRLLVAAPDDALVVLGADPDGALDLRLAIKLALSKQQMTGMGWSGRLGIVFAMLGGATQTPAPHRRQPHWRGRPAGKARSTGVVVGRYVCGLARLRRGRRRS